MTSSRGSLKSITTALKRLARSEDAERFRTCVRSTSFLSDANVDENEDNQLCIGQAATNAISHAIATAVSKMATTSSRTCHRSFIGPLAWVPDTSACPPTRPRHLGHLSTGWPFARLLEPLPRFAPRNDALVDEHVDQHGDDAHLAGGEFGCVIFVHRSPIGRRAPGTPDAKCPPDQPPSLVARNPPRANNDPRSDVFRHIFVGGDCADIAC